MLQYGSRNIYVLIFGLFICSNVFATVSVADLNKQGVIYFAQSELYETPYEALVQRVEGDQLLTLTSEGKKLFEKKMGPVTESFKELKLKTFKSSEIVYAVILRQKGVHGEQVHVVRVSDGKEVFHTTSAWPLDYTITSDGLSVSVVDEDRKEIKKNWKAP